MDATWWILPLLAYVAGVSLLSFAAFWLDKRQARRDGARRLPESWLLWLAAAGGTPGAFLGRRLLRHKTVKEPFVTRLRLIAAAQVAAAVAALAFLAG